MQHQDKADAFETQEAHQQWRRARAHDDEVGAEAADVIDDLEGLIELGKMEGNAALAA